jgi:ABC-type sulfate transport system substrate-binding protein
VGITFPPVADPFTIEQFGGWPDARATFFGDEGIFTRLIAEIKGF